MSYEFELPFPPSVNQWKTPFKGRAILTKRGRDYRAKVIEAMQSLGLSDEMLSGRLTVKICLYMPDRRRRDIDNYLKSLLDGLTHAGFWVDDDQIDSLTVKRCGIEKGGRAVIRVEETSQR